MAWGKVDDGLHKSVKWRRATKGARALWTTSLSWCMDELTDGFVPKDMLRVLDGTTREAANLVEVGLWDERRNGWKFHDWHEYQPDAASIKAKKASESSGAALGNHRRWHLGRSIVVPGCEYCDGMPPDSDVEPPRDDWEDAENTSGTRSGTRSGQHRGTRIGGESPVPEPDPIPITQVGGGGNQSNTRPSDPPPPPPTPEILNNLQEPWRCPIHQGRDEPCHHCKAYKTAHKTLEAQRAKDEKAAARAAQRERERTEEPPPLTPDDEAKITDAKAKALAAAKGATK